MEVNSFLRLSFSFLFHSGKPEFRNTDSWYMLGLQLSLAKEWFETKSYGRGDADFSAA